MKCLRKILSVLNVKLDRNQRYIAVSILTFSLINSYTSPAIVKEIITNLPAEFIACQNLVLAVSSILIGAVWQGKIRKSVIKYFIFFISAESISAFLLSMYLAFIEYNVWVFAVTSLIYTSLITIFVSKCIMVFKSKLWREKERETYDNNEDIIYGFTTIVGMGCAIICLPSIKTAIVLFGISCLLDNVAWGCVYLRNRKILISE